MLRKSILYLVAAQPTNADLNIYNIEERGDIGFKRIICRVLVSLLQTQSSTEKAQSLLDWVRKGTIWDRSEMTYSGVTNMAHLQ